MPTRQIKNSYNKGEMSPYMDGRTDITHYYNGCSKLINALVLPHGGFTKRPGTEYIATAANKCKLFPFEFSVNDALILEFSNLLLRFYKDQAIVNKGVGYEDLSGVDDDALIAHWLLNEISGVTAVNDDVPGTHDGEISVDADTIHEDGKVGSGCFNLDGLYTVKIGDNAVFSFTTGAADKTFSIACWAYVTEKGGLQVLMSKWQDEAASEWRLSLSGDRKLQLHLADSSTNLLTARVAQWKLNDKLVDQVVLDSDASAHNGTTETANTTDLNATGKLNDCFDFAGADCVILDADDDELSFVTGGGADKPFSIAAWIYNDGTGFHQMILSKWDFTTDFEAREWYFSMADRKIILALYDESANAYERKITDDRLSTGWHFVAATYNGVGGVDAADGITIYVDGIAVAGTTDDDGTYVDMENLGTKVIIGAAEIADGSYGYYWRNKLDNVILFNTKLSAASVIALWNDGNGTEDLAAADNLISAVSNAAISTGWHFFCATYDAANAAGIILYVDGATVDSTNTDNVDYGEMQSGGLDVWIGSQLDSAGTANERFWEDKIDEVSIFSDVLNPEEVASLYSTTPYSIVSPYTSAEAFQIHVTQSADVMYIAHEDHHPKKLSRLDALLWTIEDVSFTGGPFLYENTESDYLVGFARTGGTAMSGYYFPAGAIGTLTASDVDAGNDNQPFNSKMVGGLWLIKHTRPDNKTETFDSDDNTKPTDLDNAIRIKGDYTVVFEPIATSKEAKLWRIQGNGNWQEYRSFRSPTAFTGAEDEDDVYYCMTRDDGAIGGTLTAKNAVNRGVVKITGYTSSTVVTVEVIDAVLSDNDSDVAVTTPMWAEGAWSDYRGYPRTVTFFEDRLWWASSTNNPDTKWGSKSRLYENMEFTNLGLDDDAIVAPLNDNEISQIQWMFPRIVMAVGAANKEYRFGASNPDNPVTPADRKATPQTSFGSDSIQPVILQDALFFLQRQGKKLRAMKFDSITENFTADDVTLLAYGIFDSAPTCMAVQRSPDSIIWIPRTDGIMPTFTYEPVEEVAGWARQIFGNSAAVETATGYIESVAVIHGSAEDEIWVSIRRIINHNIVYYIEKFKPRDWGNNIEDAFFVDSGLTAFDGGAEKVITNITRANPCVVTASAHGFLDGQQVYIDTILTPAEIAIITTYDINSNDKIDLLEYTTANSDNSAGVLSDKLKAIMWDMYGGEVLISTLTSSMNELNDTVYTVANAADNDFSLKDSTDTTAINSSDYDLYTAGATVKRVENVINGLDHLEGEEVAIFADGKVLAKETVSSYQITIDEFANKVQVGIPYTMKARTMRLAVPPPNTIQTRIKRINRTVVRYIRSLLGKAGQEYSGVEYLTDIKATYSTASQDTPKDNRLTRGGFSEDVYTIIVSDDPVPFTCLATIIDVEIE